MGRKKGKAASPRHDWSSLDRRMIADDASWAQSLARSSLLDDDWQGIMGLTFLPHCARIVHESYKYLTHKHSTTARTIHLKFGAEIAAARHTVKLLDDSVKLYDGVIADFARIAEAHHSTFGRWRNLSIAMRDGHLFTTTRVADFQRAFSPDELMARRHAYGIGYDMGQALPSVLDALGLPWPTPVALPLPPGQAPQPQDFRADAYYSDRFEPEFPEALKDVLTVVESVVNTGLIVFAPSSVAFSGPVFRARVVNAIHALKALTEILERHQELANRPGLIAIRRVLETPAACRLLSNDLRLLRNRCMHYGIPSHLSGLSPHLPAYGLVEATTDTAYETINRHILTTLTDLSAAFAGW